MKNTLSTTTTTTNPILDAVNAYLDTVQTKSGKKPGETTRQNFINQCIAYELNPIKRQAYLTGYDSKDGAKFTFIVAIDGFASIASRTGQYAGKDQARYTYIPNTDQIESAVVTVYRMVQGQRCAFTGQAFYIEYKQDSSMWLKMPKTMLEKCAFAKALRAAFPETLSGMYTDDEINTNYINTEQITELEDLLELYSQVKKEDLEKIKQGFFKIYKINSISELTSRQFENAIEVVNKLINKVKDDENKKVDIEVEPLDQVADGSLIAGVRPATKID
jgi:phage recombination protein Bet